MDEDIARELLNYIRLNSADCVATQAKLESCSQAMKWATQVQNWNFIVELASELSLCFDTSYSFPQNVVDQNKEETTASNRNFWEQGKRFATMGLSAARRLRDREKELGFLANLARLSDCLGDLTAAKDYLWQQYALVPKDMKWRIARELHMLGNKAGSQGNYLTARDCYYMCLNIHQELGQKGAMIEDLAFLATNETMWSEKAGELGHNKLDPLIDSLWQLRDALGNESTSDQVVLTGNTSSSTNKIYERIQDTIAELNQYR